MSGLFESMAKAASAPARELIQTFAEYDLAAFMADSMAGLTVAVVELPQAMAYAMIAGVPAAYGIYTSIVQGIIGSLLASNDLLATGPTNTQSLLIAATVSRVIGQSGAQAGPALYLKLAIGLTVVKGLVQILFATARLGALVRYVSRSVIVGFTAGAGILIIFGQLPNFLGLQTGSGASSLPGLLGSVPRLLWHVGDVNAHALGLGFGLLVLLVALRRWQPRAPGPLIVVVLGAIVVAAMHWTSGELSLVGRLPGSLPKPSIPAIDLQQAESLIGGAVALAILGMIETVGIGKSVAMKTGQRIDANREFMAQGIANLVGGCFQNIPGSGSFTRTALNQMAGARTRLAGVFNSLIIAGLFLALGSEARYIPLTALAAVLFIVAWGLIDWRQILRILRTSPGEAGICLATLFAALVLPLSYAIFVGVILSISLYLRRAGQLQLQELVQSRSGLFLERPVDRADGPRPRMVFLQVGGDLFFGVAHELEDRLLAIEEHGAQVIILRLKRCPSIDTTTLTVLQRVIGGIQDRGGHVILCGVQPQVEKKLVQFGLIDQLGRENVIPASRGGFESAKQAIHHGRSLLGFVPSLELPAVVEPVEYVI